MLVGKAVELKSVAIFTMFEPEAGLLNIEVRPVQIVINLLH